MRTKKIIVLTIVIILALSQNLYAMGGLMLAGNGNDESFTYVNTVENHKIAISTSGRYMRIECLNEPYTFYNEIDTVGFEKCVSCNKEIRFNTIHEELLLDKATKNVNTSKVVIICSMAFILLLLVIKWISNSINNYLENRKLSIKVDEYLDCNGNKITDNMHIIYNGKSYRTYNINGKNIGICLDDEDTRLREDYKLKLTDLKELDTNKIELLNNDY